MTRKKSLTGLDGPGSVSRIYQEFFRERNEQIRSFYDKAGESVEKNWWKRKYYDGWIADFLASRVMPNSRILDLGCGTGHLLASLSPSRGVGIDLSPKMIEIAKRNHPGLEFHVGDAKDLDEIEGPFDYILAINLFQEASDIIAILEAAQRISEPSTQIVVITTNDFWRFLYPMLEALGLKQRNLQFNWLDETEVAIFLRATGFEVVWSGRMMPFPFRIPLFSWFINNIFGILPLFRRTGYVQYCFARPMGGKGYQGEYSCSVVVPCKDEEDNVLHIVKRIPKMGRWTEIIFVDDKSNDRTREYIKTLILKHPDKRIKLVDGPGKGKGAACREGFHAAEGDIIMILDADMTVMPEDLPKFYTALANGYGDFINGSRMVYELGEQSMRFLNVYGNKFFSKLVSFILGKPISDTLCGTKVFWRKDLPKYFRARKLFNNIDKWGDYDLIFGAALHNLKIVELPVHYRERVAGQTKMMKRFSNAWIMFKMCWQALLKFHIHRSLK